MQIYDSVFGRKIETFNCNSNSLELKKSVHEWNVTAEQKTIV